MKRTELRIGEEYAVDRYNKRRIRLTYIDSGNGHHARHRGVVLNRDTGELEAGSEWFGTSRDVEATWAAYRPYYEKEKQAKAERAKELQLAQEINQRRQEQAEEIALLLSGVTGYQFTIKAKTNRYGVVTQAEDYPFDIILDEPQDDLLATLQRAMELKLMAVAEELRQ